MAETAGWRTPPAPIDAARITKRLETDVAVVGLGYAGSAALRAAAERGVRAVGLEAAPERRFMTFGRDVGHINSAFLRSRGIPAVDELDFYNEWIRRAGNRANPALIMRFVKNSGAAFDWYTDMYGIEGLRDVHVSFWPDASPRFDGVVGAHRFWRGTAQFPEPRGWKGSPCLTDVVRANHRAAQSLGAQVLYGTAAVRLELDGDGRPCAVLAQDPDGGYVRCAARAVVLAAGDFSSDPEMLADLVPDYQDLFLPGENAPRMLGRSGMGVRLGVWAGGRLEPRPIPIMGGNNNTLVGVTGTCGVLWLDPRCRRYCNEAFGDPVFNGFPGAVQGRGTYFHVFDASVGDTLVWSPPAHGCFDAAEPKQPQALADAMTQAREAGPGGVDLSSPGRKTRLVCGETWEELADNIGLAEADKATFLRSVARYNALCHAGRDEDFGKDAKLLYPLEHAPFFAQLHSVQSPGFMLVTAGGLLTDERQNVLDAAYEPIPGLYATGNCCGRRFGVQYSTPISGVSIGIAITLGRLAGIDAANG